MSRGYPSWTPDFELPFTSSLLPCCTSPLNASSARTPLATMSLFPVPPAQPSDTTAGGPPVGVTDVFGQSVSQVEPSGQPSGSANGASQVSGAVPEDGMITDSATEEAGAAAFDPFVGAAPADPANSAVLPTTINPADLGGPQPSAQEASTSARPPPPAYMTRTGYVYDPLMMLHCNDGYTPTSDSINSGDGHPEEPMRIKRIFQRLADNGLIRRMKKLDFVEANYAQIIQVHSDELFQKVESTEMMDDDFIQNSKHYYEQLSLYVCRETAQCARLSCGGVIRACEAVCSGEVRNAFAIVRPPGHHAEPDQHMGFCFYNNVAVATREVQRLGLAKKILILDWQVRARPSCHADQAGMSIMAMGHSEHSGLTPTSSTFPYIGTMAASSTRRVIMAH